MAHIPAPLGALMLCIGLAGCEPRAATRATDSPGPTPGPAVSAVASGAHGETERGVGPVIAELGGLAFDDFLEKSYWALVSRSPEKVTALAAGDRTGIGDGLLEDLSPAYAKDTHALERAVRDLLGSYDRAALTPEQRTSYDAYGWYLDDLVRGQRYCEHGYLITHCRIGHHYRLLSLLTEAHPLDTAQNARDYVARLAQVDDQVAQVLDGMARREAAGVFPPDFIVDRAMAVLQDYLGTRSRDPRDVDVRGLSVYTRFAEELEAIPDLDQEERRALRDRAVAELEASFVPAYMAQLAYLEHLATVATSDAGVWKLPDGDEYYRLLVRSHTTVDLRPEEIHETGLREVERLQGEMRAAIARMGHPAGPSLAEMVDRVVHEAGVMPLATQEERDAATREWAALVRDAERSTDAAFGLRPGAGIVVVGGLAGEYYAPAPFDGTQPCEFHVGRSSAGQPRYLMRTIVAHEAVPGHHYQIGLARELELPSFRAHLRLDAFNEGWAVYAEKLAWELGYFQDDPHGDIGRLLSELLRAVRLVVDTGIHARHWSREQARDYMDSTLGARPGTFDDEVDRIVVAPARAISNEIGALQLLEMRARARARLGDRFDLGAFHDIVIGGGTLPLPVLALCVDAYVAAASGAGR